MRVVRLLSSLLLVAASISHAAGSDTAAPQLASVIVPPLAASADSGGGNVFFEVSTSISDAGGSGANYAEMHFVRKAADGVWEFGAAFTFQELLEPHRLAGNANGGHYRLRVRIPAGTPAGSYHLHSLRIFDEAGNNSSYFADASGGDDIPLPAGATSALHLAHFEQEQVLPAGGPDAFLPTINSARASASVVDISTGAAFVDLEIAAADTTSGLSFVDVWLVSPDGSAYSQGRGQGAAGAIVGGSLVDGTYALRVRIPKEAPAGYWTFGGVLVADAAGNLAFARPALRLAVTAGDDGDGYLGENDAFPFDAAEWADHDGDDVGDNADLDDDNDLLDDAWEIAQGLNPLATDTDGDGYSDRAELQAGVQPLARDSTPASLAEIEMDAAETHFSFSFYSRIYQKYRLETSTDLQNWRTAVEMIPGTGGKIALQVSTDSSAQLFIRALELP